VNTGLDRTLNTTLKTLDQIASELQGYDPQALSAGDVLNFLEQLVVPIEEWHDCALFEAVGRVLASDVVSPFDVPPHDNSAMDGYAFAAAPPGCGQALSLHVLGTALAGRAWPGFVEAGQCVKIMTGAIMPAGTDTVVPQEFVQREGDLVIVPPDLVSIGDNRRHRGEDLSQGKPALFQGDLITPARLGLAASLGLGTLPCFRRLRVAYFSTGDEILSLGEAPREGAVYDSNRYTVYALLTRMGCEVIDMGVVKDDPALLEAAFRQAAFQADAIITSGGVSVGEADHTKTMMKKLGDVAFWRIAMRPGRPMAVGRILSDDLSLQTQHLPSDAVLDSDEQAGNRTGRSVLFGLPGNPVAVMVTFLAFVRPTLLQMMGAKHTQPVLLKAASSEAIRKKPGRTEYQRGWVSTADDGSLVVRTTGSQGSGVLRSMAEANGLIVLHHTQGNVTPGEAVDVMMFDGAI
jgi:molybdopterin molybdotransferase